MARNKRPALTSPWKIGFLASLLPVLVAIGVGYFITREFGLAWTWIQFHGSWKDFTFHRDVFMTQMLPAAALVAGVALLSHLLITNAVRRYRAYFDSGLDYKNFVKNLRKIEDLDNEKKLKKLSKQPELRDLLIDVRRTIAEREDALDAREAALAEREAQAGGGGNLGSDAEVLVDALAHSRKGALAEDLAIESPELRRVEQAIRKRLAGAATPSEDETRWAETCDALSASSRSLSGKLDEILEEMTSSERGARELETEIERLRERLPELSASQSAGGAGRESARAFGRLDSLSQTLRALGEETRSVAINTALQAGSGDGTGESVVQLADDVRELAAKFNGVAEQWEEASAEARRDLGSPAPARRGGKPDDVAAAIDTLTSHMGLWVERWVILSEKIKSFEKHYNDAFATLSGAPSSAGSGVDEGWSHPAPERGRPMVTASADDSGEFERQGDPAEILITSAAVDEDFAHSGEESGEFDSMSSDDAMFADIPGDAPKERTARTRFDDPVQAPDETAEFEAPEQDEEEEFMHGASYPKPATPAAAPRPNEPRFATSSHIEEIESIPSPEDDVISLYELGAVDYEPANAHHNV